MGKQNNNGPGSGTDADLNVAADQRVGEHLYHEIVEIADEAMAILDGNTIIECNAKAVELFRQSRAWIIGKTPWEISPDLPVDDAPTQSQGRQYLREAYDVGAVRFEWQHVDADGSIVHLDVALTRIDAAASRRMLLVIRDITARKIAELQLCERIDFQTSLVALSNSLGNAKNEDMVETMSDALNFTGERYDLDQIRIWWDDLDARSARCSHHWTVDGLLSNRDELPVRHLPWSHQILSAGQSYYFSDIDELPDEAEIDRALCIAAGVVSLYCTPVSVDRKVVGNVAFATLYKPRHWSEREMIELRLIAQVLASTWQRYEYVLAIHQHESELLRSQRVASVGSYTEIARPGTNLTETFGISKLSEQAREIYAIEPGMESMDLILARIHPDDREAFTNSVRDLDPNVGSTRHDYRVVHPDGNLIYVEDHKVVDRNEKGDVIKVFGTVRDVTLRVTENLKLVEALAEIEELKNQLQEENLFLKQEVIAAKRSEKIIGDNPRFRSALVAAEKVAPTDVTVLILGETGTGKELIAREIHDRSERRDIPLISVNCAALSTELIESELFGHEVGAFTGAQKQRKGRFELADGGTLFLDEIGDLSPEVQAKILRVLQTADFERLGGTQTLHVDVRLIAATNRDLRQMIQTDKFRADLYYRINSFPIEIPPLRERRDDIPALANFLVRKHSKRLGKQIESISPGMIRRLCEMDWPGNVRELESHIQRALIAATGSILNYQDVTTPAPADIRVQSWQDMSDVPDLDSVQQHHILNVLKQCDWVIDGANGAAVRLGVPPSTLRSRMKKLGIERPI